MIAQRFKRVGLSALRSVGAFSWAANSARRSDRLLILCFHGISLRDEHEWLPRLYITPDQFRRRMRILRSYDASVLPLGEAVDRLRTRSLPPRSVAITFDDGFHDFLHHAVPVLQKFGYPSTLYLTTHHCGYRVPIFHLVTSYLLWKSRLQVVDLTPFGVEKPALLRTRGERQATVDALREWARQNRLDTIARDMAARQLADIVRIDYDDILNSRLLQILTPDEVRTAARAGVDIQLHTHRHRTPRDRDLFLREIRDNRDRIRAMTDRGATHFCYPSGDYAPEFLPWLREAGVETATTCVLGLAGPASDPLLLPRVLDDSTVGDIDFESWVCGLRA